MLRASCVNGTLVRTGKSDLLSVTEAAERLGVNKKTLRAWADSGRIEHIKTPGGWRLFAPEALDRFTVNSTPTRGDPDSSLDERMGQKIRVLLVDGQLSFRQPLASMLMREPDITITGQAGTLAEARPLLPEVDIALIDLNLPDGEAADLIQDLHAVNPQAIALVLTGSTSSLEMPRAVEAGAASVLHKARPASEVVDAIRRVHAGERIQDHAIQATIDWLTPRERAVLQALAAGLSDREIADQLHVSTETVRTHMVNLLHKLGVDSRLKALVFALKHNLVTIT
jgi:excisionase family DNA binding protein